MNNKQTDWLGRSLAVGGTLSLGFLSSYLGGAFKRNAWIDDLPKPAIFPPQWVFPVIWIANYTLMGNAFWQVWKQRKEKSANTAINLFALQLLHNLSFIPIVYRFKKLSVYSLMDSIAFILVAFTTRAFARVSRPATFLMLPYLGWCAFTTSIKFLLWRKTARGR